MGKRLDAWAGCPLSPLSLEDRAGVSGGRTGLDTARNGELEGANDIFNRPGLATCSVRQMENVGQRLCEQPGEVDSR